MSQDRFRFPSKTFLLGEHAILQGASALLLGHPPCFEASFTAGEPGDAPFHPESPAGQWLRKFPVEGRVTFTDPHGGRGGFGASGAELLAAWSPSQTIPAPEAPHAIFAWSAWEASRAYPGSGADILVQSFGIGRASPFFLKIDLAGRSLTEVFPQPMGATLSLFHTGRKEATHEQKALPPLPVRELDEMVRRAEQALSSGALEAFAEELRLFGGKMAELGLVAPHTARALEGTRALPQVLAAKGCGAMGADVILLLHRNASLDGWAQENSLAPAGNFPV